MGGPLEVPGQFLLQQMHLETQQHNGVLPDAVGEFHVGQKHHGYFSNTVVCSQELHGNLPVVVDAVKLDQNPHDCLADAVGVEPLGDLADEVDGAQVGQKPYVDLLNEDSNPDFYFFLHCFSPLIQFQISLPSCDYV